MFTSFFAKFPEFFFAAPSADPCPEKTFFIFSSWWKYLGSETDSLGVCQPYVNFPGDIWLIGLAVLDMLVRLAGFIAVIMIVVSGVELIMSQGNAEKSAAARNRSVNALVGVAITLIATTLISFLGTRLGGSSPAGQALPHASADQTAINDILNIVFVIMGAVAVLVMVIAGLRFVMSGGDSTKVADARRQIVYAAIGLVLIAMAAAIVNFVIGRIT